MINESRSIRKITYVYIKGFKLLYCLGRRGEVLESPVKCSCIYYIQQAYHDMKNQRLTYASSCSTTCIANPEEKDVVNDILQKPSLDIAHHQLCRYE